MDTVIHCNIEKNARLIAMILDFDEEGKEFDWYEQHIANAAKYFEEQIEKLRNPPVFPDGSPIVTNFEPEYAQDRLSEIPAADVVEVVHGKDVCNTVKDHHCEFKCSICGEEIVEHWGQAFNFCPYCGAVLGGKQ